MMRSNRHVTSGLILLSGFFIASKVNGDNGPFSISVSSPAVCSASTFTYSSQMAMATGSFDIDPGLYGMGDPGQQWIFTVSAGIILDNDTWGDDGQNIDKWIKQNANGSYTFTVPTDGTWQAGMITGQANAPGEDPNKPWLETVGVSAFTSNASMAASRSVRQSSLTSHFPLSGSVRSTAAGPSSQRNSSTYLWSSGPGSHSTAKRVSSSSQHPPTSFSPTQNGTKSSGSLAVRTSSSAQSLGSSGSGIASTSVVGPWLISTSPNAGPSSTVASSAVTTSSDACATSSSARLSNNYTLPGSITFKSTQTSQSGYVNPNPFGCSEIIPSEINPILYSTVTGVSCVCQGTTLPLLPTVSNCGYQTLPSASPAYTSSGVSHTSSQPSSGIASTQGISSSVIPMKRGIQATPLSSASSAITSGAAAQSFTLTITATLPCKGPIVTPIPCAPNYIPPLTTDQWEVQHVDEFWQMYFDNKSHWQTQGLMTTFFEDFSGGAPGDGLNYVCTATDEADCLFLESCSLVATGSETWLTPYKDQAYYIWAGMTNFSKVMNMIWQALEWAAQDMDYFAGEIGSKFEVQLPGATLWSKVFPILNTILTLLAIVFIIADPFVDIALAPVVGVLIGLSASFGLAADVDAFISASEQAEVTLSTIYSDLGFSNGWITYLQNQINYMHNEIWVYGAYDANGTANSTDVTQLMTGGTYVSSARILATVDLNSVPRANSTAGPTNAVSEWFENLLVANLINNWFRSNNAYIVYIPYGQVSGLNSQNSEETFTEDDCNSKWIATTNWYSEKSWNSTVVVNCESGGMAVLMNGASSMEDPSFYEVANMTYNGYTYSAQDMITSSVNGFLQYGFNYNATDSFVSKLLDPTVENLNNISQYLHLEPTSPGMYNLPVCRLTDLGAVPNSLQGPWPKGQDPGWPSQKQPCSCMSDAASITINGKTSYFRDFAGDPTTQQLNKLINGNVNDTCYVVPQGATDCEDFPSLCWVPSGPLRERQEESG